MFNLENAVILGAFVFACGVYGVLARRNLLVILMSVEVMLNGVNIVLAAFARTFAALGQADAAGAGQVFVLMSMAVAACEVAVGLSLLIAVFRHRRTVNAGELSFLRG